MPDDPQDIAEALDADVIDDQDDYAGDDVLQYPPDRPIAMDEFDMAGVDAGESATEGLDIIDTSDGELTGEEAAVAAVDLSAEEAAMHVEGG